MQYARLFIQDFVVMLSLIQYLCAVCAFRGKTVISNATRWDTFENMIGEDRLPESERLFRCERESSDQQISGKGGKSHVGGRGGDESLWG